MWSFSMQLQRQRRVPNPNRQSGCESLTYAGLSIVRDQSCAISLTGGPFRARRCSMDPAGRRFRAWSSTLCDQIMQGDQLAAEDTDKRIVLKPRHARLAQRSCKSVGLVYNLHLQSNIQIFAMKRIYIYILSFWRRSIFQTITMTRMLLSQFGRGFTRIRLFFTEYSKSYLSKKRSLGRSA